LEFCVVIDLRKCFGGLKKFVGIWMTGELETLGLRGLESFKEFQGRYQSKQSSTEGVQIFNYSKKLKLLQ
jgi:hypothetical protein